MKKILFSFLAAATISMGHAQIFSADDSVSFSTMGQFDADGDGIGWEYIDLSGFADPDLAAQGGVMLGESWRGAPLTPDNFLMTPAMDFSNETAVNFNYTVGVFDPDFPSEKYSVYVVADTSAAALATATPVFSETLTADDTLPNNRYLNLSAMAGQSAVYVVFRHHDVTDQFVMFLDDMEVSSSTASIVENDEIAVSVSPNPTTEMLTFDFDGDVQIIEIYSLNGTLVKRTTEKEINVAELANGTYVYNVLTSAGRVSNGNFVKK